MQHSFTEWFFCVKHWVRHQKHNKGKRNNRRSVQSCLRDKSEVVEITGSW